MTEQITYLPSRRTFFTPVCPALGLQEGVSAEVLGAELDPRKGSRAKKFGKKDIVLSVRITNPNMPEGKNLKNSYRIEKENSSTNFRCNW